MTIDELLQDPAFRELVGKFLGVLAERVEGIEQAAATGDEATLVRLAHQLAGAGGGFGFTRISQLAGEIERLGHASASADRLHDSIEQLRSAADTAIAEWAKEPTATGC